EATESRVDAVGVLGGPVCRPLDELPGDSHAAAGVVRERSGSAFDCDGPHIGNREVVARQADGGALRHARASLSPARGRPLTPERCSLRLYPAPTAWASAIRRPPRPSPLAWTQG